MNQFYLRHKSHLPSSLFLLALAIITGAMLLKNDSASAQVVSPNPIDSLQPGMWYQVPNSKLKDQDPCPFRGCIYSGYSGMGSIVDAWNSAVYDTKRDQLVIWGGGHADYGGNEFYAFNINTLKWKRLNEPSTNMPRIGTVPNASVNVYADGKPVSVHTYNGIQYAESADRFITVGGSRWYDGAGTPKTWSFNFDTLTWQEMLSAPSSVYYLYEIISAYDPVTGLVFYLGPAQGPLFAFDPIRNSWSVRGNFNQAGGSKMTATIDSKRHRMIVVGNGYATFSYDLNLPGIIPRVSLLTTGAKEIEAIRTPGLAYDPVSDKIVAWGGGTSVYTLNLDTLVWTKLAPAPGNSINPGNANSNGTFGRFRYIGSKNAFILVNSALGDVYIYKLSSGAGVTPTPTPPTPTPPPTPPPPPPPTPTPPPPSPTPTPPTPTPPSPTPPPPSPPAPTPTPSPSPSPVADTEAPSGPQGLMAFTISTSQIILTWYSSTDNKAVTGYRIYRTVGTAFTAKEEQKNLANISAGVGSLGLLQDILFSFSTAIKKVALVIASIFDQTIDLPKMLAQVSNSNGTLLGSTSSTYFEDKGLSPGTNYTYRIEAYDAAGNVSTKSNTVTATTLALPSPITPPPPQATPNPGTAYLPLPPTITFIAAPAQITRGESSTLIWRAENATLCEGSGEWAGRLLTASYFVVSNIRQTANYILTCTGPYGVTVSKVTVVVIDQPANVTNSYVNVPLPNPIFYSPNISTAITPQPLVQGPDPCINIKGQIYENLAYGLRGRDVTLLQCKLIKLRYLASGNATGYFGPKTAQAVKNLQCNQFITTCQNSAPGYGLVGPKTRRFLNLQ